MGTTSQAQIDAVARYDSKTYQSFMLKLRKEEDADIIAAIRAAEWNEIVSRWNGAEWLIR